MYGETERLFFQKLLICIMHVQLQQQSLAETTVIIMLHLGILFYKIISDY